LRGIIRLACNLGRNRIAKKLIITHFNFVEIF